jgi:hypothetical protein
MARGDTKWTRARGVTVLAIAAAVIGSAALAADGPARKGPLQGTYLKYSRFLGDYDLPTKRDTKISFHLTGKLAADLYRSLGPAAKERENCEPDIIIESRRRGDIDCVLYKKEGPECWFGLDLATGRSMNGSVC